MTSVLSAAEHQKDQGNVAYRQKDFRGAAELYRAAISHLRDDAQLDPHAGVHANANALRLALSSNLAQCYLELKDYVNAIAACASAKFIDQYDVKVNYRMATALLRLAAASDASSMMAGLGLKPAATLNDKAAELNADVVRSALADISEACNKTPGNNELQSRRDDLGRLYARIVTAAGPSPSAPSSARVSWKKQPITKSHFPAPCCSGLTYTPSPDGVDENVLVLLHGLGEASEQPFSRLGATMALPQTACLALAAPSQVPVLGGGMWFTAFTDDGSYEMLTTEKVMLMGGYGGKGPGFNAASSPRCASLQRVVRPLADSLLLLSATHGWPADRIHLLGFGQGATLALHTALECHRTRGKPLRSCIAICGAVLPEAGLGDASSISSSSGSATTTAGAPQDVSGASALSSSATATDYLLVHSKQDPTTAPVDVRATTDAIASLSTPSCPVTCTAVAWSRPPSMPRSKDEMQPVMAVLARALTRRMTSLEADPDVIRVN